MTGALLPARAAARRAAALHVRRLLGRPPLAQALPPPRHPALSRPTALNQRGGGDRRRLLPACAGSPCPPSRRRACTRCGSRCETSGTTLSPRGACPELSLSLPGASPLQARPRRVAHRRRRRRRAARRVGERLPARRRGVAAALRADGAGAGRQAGGGGGAALSIPECGLPLHGRANPRAPPVDSGCGRRRHNRRTATHCGRRVWSGLVAMGSSRGVTLATCALAT